MALGPLIGGAVVEGWNWQAIFWLNVPIGLIAVPLALIALPEQRRRAGARRRRRRRCWRAWACSALVFGIVRGNDAGWTSAQVVGSLVAGVALLLGFLVWESRVPAPLLPLRLFRDRSFTVANVVGFAFSFGIVRRRCSS